MSLVYIPKKLQNAIFGLLLFPLRALKKFRHRAGYDSTFSKPGAKKSSRPKTSILKYLGYKSSLFLFSLLICVSCGTRTDLAPISELRWQPYSQNPRTHIVRAGETLYAIAFRYDTDYRTLAHWNRMRPPYALRVGQVLSLQLANRRSPVPARPHPVYQQPRFVPKPFTPPIHSPQYPTSKGWIWPATGQVSTTFIPDQGKKGINIACKKGEKIHASSGGVVAYSGNGLAGYGNLIIIKHNNEYLTAYGNNTRNLVSEGQKVQAGQVIAEAGIIDHKYWGVHFEIRKRGMPVNPLNYLQKS